MTTMPWKKILYVAAALAVAGGAFLLLRAPALVVDGGTVGSGPMDVTIDDQGETRSHDRIVVAAPVSGRLLRIGVSEGDAIAANQVIAQIAPLPQSVRERDEQAARIAAAEALQHEATEHVRHATEDLALAKKELARVEKLVQAGSLPEQQADQARNAEVTTANELDAARFRAQSAAAQVKVARSGLVSTAVGEIVQIRAPMASHVLRVVDSSERVVGAGTPLMTLGTLDRLEVVLEMLSEEAVQVRPGMPVLLEGWGGNAPLHARVRLVEPAAFTKVSALGVEEKRTNVIVDFVDSPGALGDGFRVTGRVVTWHGDNVLKVPASALFRCSEAWCAFTVENGRAVRHSVDIGHRNAVEAEVLRGLVAGQQVIRHPGNRIADGARVRVQVP